MRLPNPVVTALALVFVSWTPSAANETDKDDRLWPQVSYELLHFERKGETASHQGDVSWPRDELLRKALEVTAETDDEPLIKGWISSTAYGRLYRDHEVYLVFAPKLGTPLAQVCHVVVTGVPDTHTQPQGFAGGGGDKWCSEPGRAQIVPTPAQVRSNWPRGQVKDATVFRVTDNTTLTVRHITGLKQYSRPIPPAQVADVLTVGLMPVALEAARRTDRRLEVARLADGGWGLMLQYAPSWTNLSGCFLTAANRVAAPSEAWITPEVEKWCRDHAVRDFASIPLEQRPAVPIIVGQAEKSWTEFW